MLHKNYSFTNRIYSMYMNKQDFTINNLQGLICRKTEPINQPTNQPTFVRISRETNCYLTIIFVYIK